MKISFRSGLLIATLAVGLVSQFLIWRHLEAAGSLSQVALTNSLAAIPLELGPWQGVDRPIEDENLLYADEHLQRVYRHKSNGQVISLWAAFSKTGADRGHHPEVCMMVAGQPEDETARNELEVAGHAAPVQEYRFGRPGSFQRVHYWHYTMSGASRETTQAQQLYQRLRNRPSSVTLEIFVPEQLDASAELAREFVRLIDHEIQPLIGPNAERGSQRSPVTYVADN